ncbi:dihydrouridine synthase-domain-containing protein [Lobosporangium transversale]|uniref:tRNA-dihydrouridine(16/17) synthase [NAD(P)(+)] n=1 Tax=Lobosporangium transversale TaxID=64571 RepID=A0A1Y2GX54_9FUNG|nr:dihydrouridine synthase-domain-containing protein [Lobosporangium transversale]ORZ21927.1 dihydrouridine synthase-domain-containing protein [Lobosporangium transversale]|eukprot:XP_021883178.1 dihydrouridine synthase-domain-containing protein [Lobosporangium transversale]
MINPIKNQAEQRNLAAAAKCRAEHSFPPKLSGWEFYRSIGSPKYIVAPMVDQSELAWRILSRRYNADLCYTPMFNAKLFIENKRYRDEQWTGLEEGLEGGGLNDRPLIAQFCANDPECLLQAALMVAPYCDAVDLNLGCPQHIARRGHYGSFLMEDWPLISSLISTLHRHLPIPVTAKIRVFPEVEKTIEYAKMVVESGAQMLVVHGRLREMKGHLTGIADWEKIRLVQEAVGDLVPVIANGNILYHEDLAKCLEKTGCAGVMTAEGNLYNPGIFQPGHLEAWKLAEEYLTICDQVETKLAHIRGHLFKIFRTSLLVHTDLRSELGLAESNEQMWAVTKKLKARLMADAEASRSTRGDSKDQADNQGFPTLPHWFVQPYIRPEQQQQQQQQKCKSNNEQEVLGTTMIASGKVDIMTTEQHKDELSIITAATESDQAQDINSIISNKRVKKIKPVYNLCLSGACHHSYSLKCVHQRCKHCCRDHMRAIGTFDCEQHQIRSLKLQQGPFGEVADSQERASVILLENMPNHEPTVDSESKRT